MATERIIDHIDRLREKPEHVRHRIAVLTAAGITGIVAVTWMGALASSGTLALKTGATPENGSGTGEVTKTISESTSAFSNLMGAAGAAFNATSTEAALQIIETRTSSTLDAKVGPANATNKTVIPF